MKLLCGIFTSFFQQSEATEGVLKAGCPWGCMMCEGLPNAMNFISGKAVIRLKMMSTAVQKLAV